MCMCVLLEKGVKIYYSDFGFLSFSLKFYKFLLYVYELLLIDSNKYITAVSSLSSVSLSLTKLFASKHSLSDRIEKHQLNFGYCLPCYTFSHAVIFILSVPLCFRCASQRAHIIKFHFYILSDNRCQLLTALNSVTFNVSTDIHGYESIILVSTYYLSHLLRFFILTFRVFL